MKLFYKSSDGRSYRIDAIYQADGVREFIEVSGGPNKLRREYDLIGAHCEKCYHPANDVGITSCYSCEDWEYLDRLVSMGQYVKYEYQKDDDYFSKDILKSKEDRNYSYALGSALAEFIACEESALKGYDLAIPVPSFETNSNRGKMSKERAILKCLEYCLKMPLRDDILVKITNEKMKGLKKYERKLLAQKQIQINDNIEFSAKRILVIDDVVTTGITMDRCAQLLKEMGAKEVVGVSVARYANKRIPKRSVRI